MQTSTTTPQVSYTSTDVTPILIGNKGSSQNQWLTYTTEYPYYTVYSNGSTMGTQIVIPDNNYWVDMWTNSSQKVGYTLTRTGYNNVYIGYDSGYPQKSEKQIKREARKNKLSEIFGDDI